tara:strand:+ start:473 stop:1117 length:645 start_codon:yes stop_codon:yes gene_type:complete
MLTNANLLNKSISNQMVNWEPQVYQAAFSEVEIKRIQRQMEGFAFEPAMTHGDEALFGSPDQDGFRQTLISPIPMTQDFAWLYSKIEDYALMANQQTNWNFTLWGNMEHANYLKYTEDMKGKYDYHVDIGTSGPSLYRKISCSILLTEPDKYEGGELLFNSDEQTSQSVWNDKIKSFPAGTIILFPSFTLHAVKPVTKGQRDAVVLWLHGKPFS